MTLSKVIFTVMFIILFSGIIFSNEIIDWVESKRDHTINPKTHDSEGRRKPTYLVEMCVNGVVYYSGGNHFAPKLDKHSKVVTCG